MSTNEWLKLVADVQSLSNQVSALTSQSASAVTKGYWGLGIAGLSMLVSVGALVWSKKSNKAQLLQQVKNSIDSAKTQVENVSLQMSELTAKSRRSADEQRQLDAMLKIQDSALERSLMRMRMDARNMMQISYSEMSSESPTLRILGSMFDNSLLSSRVR